MSIAEGREAPRTQVPVSPRVRPPERSTVDSAGKLKPGKPTRGQVRGGRLTVDLGAGSATVLTLDR